MKNETLKDLDELNILTLFEKMSVGNVVRGCNWLVDSIREAADLIINPQKKEKEVKEERKTKRRG